MTKDPRQGPLRSALNAIKGSYLFSRPTAETETVSESFNAELEDGTEVLFERQGTTISRTHAVHRDPSGVRRPLDDGEYRLRGNVPFRVKGGQIDFDALMADPDGYTPFQQYGAWREVVALRNALLSHPESSKIDDAVRCLAMDGTYYFAVRCGEGEPYLAYHVSDRTLVPLEDGEYDLTEDLRFVVEEGSMTPESLKTFKQYSYESTRLPRDDTAPKGDET